MDLLIDFVKYNHWANERIIEILQENRSLIRKETPNSFNSIQKTLLHIWDAQVIWLNRLQGVILEGWPSADFDGTIEEVFTMLRTSSQTFYDYCIEEADNLTSTNISYSNSSGQHFNHPKSEVVQHVMNHSTYHRGQLITMLHQLGGSGFRQTDYIAYLREK